MEPREGGAAVTVGSDGLAHFVAVDVASRGAVLTDNFSSLLPGQSRELLVEARETIRPEMVSVRCLNNIRG